MRLSFGFTVVLSVAMLWGCHKQVDYFGRVESTEPKVIALDFNAPWKPKIQQELMKHGYKVLNVASKVQRKELDDTGKAVDSFNVSESRYILSIDAHYYTDAMNRCFGGGYKFDYITASLIDTRTNEIVASYSDSGYSENCPPMSGHIFENTALMVDKAWGQDVNIK